MGKTLNESMEDFIGFMNKYTSMDDIMPTDRERIDLVDDNITIAFNDINDSIIDDLMGEIETANLITWEHDSDGDRPNYDNLEEWLKMYYRLEKK